MKTLRISALLLTHGLTVLIFISTTFAQAPSFPNTSHPEQSLYQIVSPQLTGLHLNQPSAFNGHLVLAGNGLHKLWDISDLAGPKLVSTLDSPYREGETESHQVTYGRLPNGRTFFSTTSGRGIDIFELTDPANPSLASTLILPGINYGDVARSVWGVSWQGHYLYVGATTFGLYVVDVSDPENPEHIATLTQAELGNVMAGPLFALGDLLVITTPKNVAGIATVDISNPRSPRLLDAEVLSPHSYSGGFYGTDAFLLNPLRRFDVTSNPRNISLISSNPIPFSEYMAFANDEIFLGGLRRASHGIHHYDMKDPENFTPLGRLVGRDPSIDDQFTMPIGNLLVMADDTRLNGEFIGAVIGVHSTEPDHTPLGVKAIYPADGTTNVSLSGQVAISFADWPELASVSPSSFLLRPVGGNPISGHWGCTYTTLSFSTDRPLLPETSYEIILPENGITDLVQNPLAQTVVSTFTTTADPSTLDPSQIILQPARVGAPTIISINQPDSTLTYEWTLGDGHTATGTSLQHTYLTPGRHQGTLTARDPAAGEEGQILTQAFTHVVHRPIPPRPPTHSSPLLLTATHALATHADNDRLSITHLPTLNVIAGHSVGERPVALAMAPDGKVWILCRDAHAIYQFEPAGNSAPTLLRTLPYASDPAALCFAPDGSAAYVTLRATSSILKLDPSDASTLASFTFPPDPDGLAPTPEGLAVGDKIYVTRAISPNSGGQVYELNHSPLSLARTYSLGIDPGPDTTKAGRGLPNYLHHITLSPDLTRAWVPGKKDNIQRGTRRDGQELVHDQTVRAFSAVLDLAAGNELSDERRDFDNLDRCHGVSFSPLGDLAFVTMPGNNEVQVVDSFSQSTLTTLETDSVPIATQIDPSNGRLYVLNQMGRSLDVFDISDLLKGGSSHSSVSRVNLISSEVLDPEVLEGKILFYSADKRLNQEGYLSCASCHIDGSHDGRTYDFSSLGEGFRNTTDLRGRAGMAHGPVHWTANFDEIHDFEGQLRGLGGASGLMTNESFFDSDRSNSLGSPKAGISPELDALAAYVSSLKTFPPSPHREEDGSLTPAALRGHSVFLQLNCSSCHGGQHFTDSPFGARHDVGTSLVTSGERLGMPLDGFDTPTLRGIWETGPYLHDGSAATLRDVLVTRNPADRHGEISTLSEDSLTDLIAYLQQLDGSNPPAPAPTAPGAHSFSNFLTSFGLTQPEDRLPSADPDHDGIPNVLEYALGGSDPTSPSQFSQTPPASHLRTQTTPVFSWLAPAGGTFSDTSYQHGNQSYRLLFSPNLDHLAPWNPAPFQASPPGLPPPPRGYRWLSAQPHDPDANFGRLGIRSKAP